MSFGTTFADAAMEQDEGETQEDGESVASAAPANYTKEWAPEAGALHEAHAANKAHAAYRDAYAGSHRVPPYMNVVITLTDAARTFAYRGLNALAGKLREIAERIAPSR